MSDKLQDNKDVIHFMLDTFPKQFTVLAKHLTRPPVELMQEIIVNILAGNFELSDEQIVQLRKYRSLLYGISDHEQIRLL